MTPHFARAAESVLLVFAGFALAGCSPVPVGTLAVSQRDGHLLIAVMRCDDTALERAAITHQGPLRTNTPSQSFDDARWTADIDDEDIVILDTADASDDWDVVDPFEELDPAVSYAASAGGDFDHPMGSVGFRTADLDALNEGQWLTYRETADGERSTSTDLDAVRSGFCDQ